MAIPQRLRRLLGSIEEKLIPTAYLEQEKAEWEQYLFDALNGDFDDNESAIVDAIEELESYNKRLAYRYNSNVYAVKFRYFNDEENKAKSVGGSMTVTGHSGEQAINKAQQRIGLYVMECAVM